MKKVPILKFEFYEQILKLESLKRESAIKKAQMGAAVGDRLDKYEDSIWEYARIEEFKITNQLIRQKHRLNKFKITRINERQKPKIIKMGVLVKLKNIRQNLDKVFLIAATSGNRRMSINAEIGKKLLGKKQGQIIKISTPDNFTQYNFTQYKVVEIHWGIREYLKNYLARYIQEEIPPVKEIKSKILPANRNTLPRPWIENTEELVQTLQNSNYLISIAEKIDYIRITTKDYDINIDGLDKTKTTLGKIKALLQNMGASYQTPF